MSSLTTYIFLLLMLFPYTLLAQEQVVVSGSVTDERGNPLTPVTIEARCAAHQSIALSDEHGNYRITLPLNRACQLVYHYLGYLSDTLNLGSTKQNISYQAVLSPSLTMLRGVNITGTQERHTTMSRIQIENFAAIPDISGSVEAIIKSLPGVSSANELSSQYSVRGGSFDENLVYVNEIEIYRPFLVRSGQQEGLSFINPDMVSALTFSAGGFDASYGDRMSSVLDITYKTPQHTAGSFSASMLGGTAHLEGASKNQKLTHISGVRYRKNAYILGTLDTKGDYDPTFSDVQTFINYRFSPHFHISFLGNYANNTYLFFPETRETTFGTLTTPLNLTILYDGQERSQFQTLFGALSFNFYPSENVSVKLITGAFKTDEEETFDIRGRYRIDEVDLVTSSGASNDSSKNISVGTKHDHARNFLDASVYSSSLKMSYHQRLLSIKTGISYRYESFHDKLNEWEMLDSAGYSLPYADTAVMLYSTRIAEQTMQNHRVSSYFQGTRHFYTAIGTVHLTGGLRHTFWSFNNTSFFSPRINISLTPFWTSDFLFRLSVGLYNQAPFYKEIRYPDGTINPNIKPQKSIHYVLGTDYNLEAWGRPFKLTTEVYYKKMDDLIPYRVDNVRVIYAGENIAEGYARGVDMRINGEFVRDTESWLSLSFMDTKQRFTQAPSFEDAMADQASSYFPRPSDQLFSLGLLFQDYLPNNPSYRIQMNLHYGSGLPISYPHSMVSENKYRYPAYRRVDMALYKHFKSKTIENNNPLLRHFTDLSLGIEIFNLFDINNTISYMWIRTVSSNPDTPAMFAIPNYLTGRVFNVKLTGKF